MLLSTLAILIATAISAPPTACPVDGPAGPAALHKAWIEKGWEYHPGDPVFDFRAKLGRFYDWSATDGLFFDDFDPERRAVHSVAEYAAIWQPIFRNNRSAYHVVSDGPYVTMEQGRLAASSIEFTARIEPKSGNPIGIATRSDLVWRCKADGWRIIREHNSSKTIPVSRAEDILRRAGHL